MSVSSSRDPRQAVLDVLDASTVGDWSNAGAKPGTIGAVDDSTFETKTNRQGDAIYVWSPNPGPLTSHGAGTEKVIEEPVVQVEAWTTNGDARADDLRRDAQSIVLSYAADNIDRTNWHSFLPENTEDRRHESQAARRGDHHVGAVQFTLDRLSDP